MSLYNKQREISMPKKTISIFFTILLATVCLFTPLTASAYEVTGFEVNAKAGMLASIDTGEVLYSKNIDEKVYPASITKIMTVTLILESPLYNGDEKIVMDSATLKTVSGTGSVVSGLKEGEEISQLDLAYLILMSSAGDCAYLAAAHYGGSVEGFVEQMNAKAQELGLTGTHYGNPVGLHDNQTYTTVKDVYTLALYALKNDTFKTICESARHTIPATNFSPQRTISTTNFLQDNTTNYYYQYAKGVKTGYTDEAGRCLVSTASYNGYNYICVLMGCPANAGKRYEFSDSASLYRWAFNNFSYKEVADTENPICEMPVNLSLETDFVPLYVEKGFISVLPNEADKSTIVIEPHLKSKSIDAPVAKGDILGTADIIYAEKIIGTVNLVAGNDVKASKLLLAGRAIKNIFTSIYMKLLITLVIIAVLIFIALVIKMNINRMRKRRVKYIPYGEGKGRRQK